MVSGHSTSEWLVYRCVALAMAAGSCCDRIETGATRQHSLILRHVREPIGFYILVLLS